MIQFNRRTDTKTMPKVPIPKVQSATARKVKMSKIRLVRSSRGHIGASAQYLDFPSISQPTLLPEQLPVIADAVCLSVLSALGDAFAARQ